MTAERNYMDELHKPLVDEASGIRDSIFEIDRFLSSLEKPGCLDLWGLLQGFNQQKLIKQREAEKMNLDKLLKRRFFQEEKERAKDKSDLGELRQLFVQEGIFLPPSFNLEPPTSDEYLKYQNPHSYFSCPDSRNENKETSIRVAGGRAILDEAQSLEWRDKEDDILFLRLLRQPGMVDNLAVRYEGEGKITKSIAVINWKGWKIETVIGTTYFDSTVTIEPYSEKYVLERLERH